MVPSAAANASLVWLDGTSADRSLVGGKGASLTRLAALGAPVPPAFALTVDAYASLARALGLPRSVAEIADDALPSIRAAIQTASLPAAVQRSLRRGFDRLRSGAGDPVELAVRSSATDEDAVAHSFAGLHETILGVRDEAELEAALKSCWASLWSERAVAYRRSNGLATAEVAIAVVVQRMIRSDVSMVVFTADPVSRREDRLVINATWGLGEAVVSGLVEPDHAVVDPDGRIVEYVIGEKGVMVVPAAIGGAGVQQVPVPRALRSIPALSPEQVKQIAATARELAARLGYPADLEGGLKDGRLYLFQARPITTLDPVGAGQARDGAKPTSSGQRPRTTD